MIPALIVFLFGLVVGSFLNVVINRYEINDGGGNIRMGGRSHCPKCKKTLQWFELVPLASFAIQKRKCRNCHELISWQYPFVELTTGVVFVLITTQYFKGGL